jgi:citrate lyase beta subunit
VFSPSDDEIDYAQRLLQAHDEQQKQGTGAFAFQGKMVDMPMVRAAQKIVAQAKAIGKLT